MDEPLEPDPLPDLLPARMLNEFVYCPRLFYLEWVDHRWADNADTAQGRFVHRGVDRDGPPMPPPEAVEEMQRARSVQLEDQRLGVVAVIDRVDHSDGTVSPVDFKKGSPDPDGRAWPADEMQVFVQAAVLRGSGYLVREAIIYYVATNQRVVIPVPEDVEDRVLDTALAAREIAAQARPPLPLVDSPKCPRCSLVTLCLPDEVNRSLQRTELPPRRIVPRDPDHRPVYVTEQGAYVGVKGGRLVVRFKQTEIASVRLIDVAQLCVYGHVQVSTEALARLWTQGSPVLWFSYGGWLNGWAQGEPHRYVELRRRQIIVHGQGGLGIAGAMLAGKIRNARTLLRRNSREPIPHAVMETLKAMERQVTTATTVGSMMGYEGTAARTYFSQFTSMLSDRESDIALSFSEGGRNRRPPRDPVNCLLSFVYGLLLKDLVAVCLGVGLDPFIGILHAPRFGRPSLALDLAEEFRPLIADSVVLQVLNNGEVKRTDFLSRSRGVMLTPEGRRTVIAAYERRLEMTVRHPQFGYQISYRRVMDVQARVLAAVMIGELPAYRAMTTR
ncbi:MAG: CRISPR-associated endonuclease Cas1 [Micropruina sp.]|uniref:CRISPR-associated endonuclease Cas4g/Cas1g n=1 Tax=Micropruina sp. TaxID=2737536 RepID=UPI0039E4DED0